MSCSFAESRHFFYPYIDSRNIRGIYIQTYRYINMDEYIECMQIYICIPCSGLTPRSAPTNITRTSRRRRVMRRDAILGLRRWREGGNTQLGQMDSDIILFGFARLGWGIVLTESLVLASWGSMHSSLPRSLSGRRCARVSPLPLRYHLPRYEGRDAVASQKALGPVLLIQFYWFF